MLKNLKLNIRFTNFDLILYSIFITIHAVILALIVIFNAQYFIVNYLSSYFLQPITLIIIFSVLMFFSYKEYTRNNINWHLFLFYFLNMLLVFFNIVGVTFLISIITDRNIFSTSTYLFFTIASILFIGLISKYDFPITRNFFEFYTESMVHFKRNIGVILTLIAVISFLSLYTGSFIYPIVFIIIIDSLYLIKAVISNIRK
jgi:hypothetical protein